MAKSIPGGAINDGPNLHAQFGQTTERFSDRARMAKSPDLRPANIKPTLIKELHQGNAILCRGGGRVQRNCRDSVTIVVGKKDQKMEKTLDLGTSVKVSKGAKKGAKEAVAEGLKADVLQNLGKKGRRAVVITDGGNKVTEIVISTGEKKKKKKNEN